MKVKELLDKIQEEYPHYSRYVRSDNFEVALPQADIDEFIQDLEKTGFVIGKAQTIPSLPLKVSIPNVGIITLKREKQIKKL